MREMIADHAGGQAIADPERLAALHDANLLDTLPEESFDRLARLAGRLLHAPLAQVNLVDDRRQFSKSSIAPPGWTAGREARLQDSFCQLTVRTGEPLVVADARTHPLVSRSAAVTEHGLVAYAGMPLVTPDGFALGTLCVGDFAPRSWTESELEVLHDLAGAVTTEIELRRENRRRVRARDEVAESRRMLSNLLGHMPGAAYRCRNDAERRMELISNGVMELTGHAPESFMSGQVAYGELIHPDDRPPVSRAVEEAVAASRPFRLEYRLHTAAGEERWVWEQGEGVTSPAGEVALEGFIADITARKHAEIELAANAATLEAVLGASPDMIELLGAGARFRWVSPAVREVLGYGSDELEGVSMLDLLHPDDRQAAGQALAALDAGGQDDFQLRYRARHRTGGWVVLDARGRRIQDHGSSAIVVVARDVTREQHMETRLSESEEVYRRLFETNPLPMWIVDPERFTFVDANAAAVRAYGYSRDEFRSMRIRDLRPADEIDRLEGAMTATSALEDLPRRTETRHVTRSGAVRDVEVHTHPVSVGGKRLFIAVAHDVTDRLTAEAALRESRDFVHSILESTPDIVFVKDVDGRYRLANSAAASLLGLSQAEVLGKTDEELFPPEVMDAFRKADRETVGTGGVVRSEQRLHTAEGLRTFLTTEAPQRDHEGRVIGVIGIARDVTDRERAFEALQAAKDEAERANRAKSEFLSRMSHELRTPMNAILGFAQLLELEVEREENQESVEQILHAGRHLLRLIDEVLDLARIEAQGPPLSLEPVRLDEVLRQSIGLVRGMAAERRVRVRVEGRCAAVVHADQQRLMQVLLNLLSNAVKYNRDDGTVTIRCEQHDATLRLLVSDTGAGIPHEKLGRLFMPFERLGAERTGVQGTGLGLSLSRGLMHAMGGEIGVESSAGNGSTFWVDLPLSTTPGAAPLPAAGAAPPGGARTILYIEDNLSNVRLMERILSQRSDLHLVPAMQGRLGIDLAHRLQPGLILLDVHLPDLDGEQVLAVLRADPDLRDIPVVVISADATPKQVERLLNAGARDYLTKPFDVRRLLAAIEDALDHGPRHG